MQSEGWLAKEPSGPGACNLNPPKGYTALSTVGMVGMVGMVGSIATIASPRGEARPF